MNYNKIIHLIIILFICQFALSLAQTTVFIPPGESINQKKKVGSTSLTGLFYELSDTFTGDVTVSHNDFEVRNYSYYALFSLSVSASVAEGTNLSGTVTYRFYDSNGNLEREANFEYVIIASEEPPDVPPTFSNVSFNPASGETGDTFDFSVVYQDDNGDAPQRVYVQLYDGGIYRGLEMESAGGSYLTGMTYARSVQILYQESGVIRFHIESTDFHSNTYRYPESGELDGPMIGSQAPVAAFRAGDRAGNAPLDVNFYDQSTGTIESWSWDFGDGSSSSLQNPSHTYTSEGVFTVHLTVTGPGGSDTETKSSYITVKRLHANFSGTPRSGTAPLTVNFTDLSTGYYSYIRWTFGDGTFSGEDNPTHTYTSAGSYDVKLIIGETGSTAKGDDQTKYNYIVVTDQQQETVSTPNTPTGPSGGKVGQSLTFRTGGATSNMGHEIEYKFNWGDGSQSSWGSSTRSHTFTSSGVKNVKVQARCKTHPSVLSEYSNSKAVSISYCVLAVSISPAGAGAVIKNPNKTNFSYDETVQLTAQATGNYQFDHWSGNISGSANPINFKMNDNKAVIAHFTETTPSDNLVKNPEFDNDMDHWFMLWFEGSSCNYWIDENYRLSGKKSFACNISNGSSEDWHIQLNQYIPVKKNQEYTVRFKAKLVGASAKKIRLESQQDRNPWKAYMNYYPILYSSINEYGPYVLKANSDDASARFKFYIGGTDNITVYIDDVVIEEGDTRFPVEEDDHQIQMPEQCVLHQNFPNPFNCTTNIRFTLKNDAHVQLKIYNLKGEVLSELINGHRSVGEHIISWDATDQPSGTYIIRMQADDVVLNRKCVLLK